MAGFVKGDVVVVPFPFSDLSQAKRRPALVVATLEGDDLILCQITSQLVGDRYALGLEESDFQQGCLKHTSNIRPNRVFTADQRLILYRVGNVTAKKLDTVTESIITILRH